MAKAGSKLKLIIYIAIVSAICAFLFFNKFGILKYLKLYNQHKQLETQVQNMEIENNKLKAEIDSLKKEDIKIEKVAREKFNMKKNGEKIFKVEEK